MEVAIVREEGRRHRAVAVRDDGSVVRFVVHDHGDSAPHDLVHFAVEGALGLPWGFYGLLAAGAPFEALTALEGGGDAPPELLVEHRDELLAAERLVSELGDPRGGTPAGLDDGAAERARACVEALHARWRELPVGGRLRLRWPPDPADGPA